MKKWYDQPYIGADEELLELVIQLKEYPTAPYGRRLF